MLINQEILPNQLLLNKEVASVTETISLGKKVGKLLEKDLPALILLEGDMGAGKTYFTKGLAAYYGISPEDVTSPTFLILREHIYPEGKLYHLDFYRIIDKVEFQSYFGQFEDLGRRDLVVIEWPPKLSVEQIKRVKELFDSFIKVKIEIVAPDRRKIKVEKL